MKLLYALIAAFIVLGGSFAYANAASIFQVIQGGTGWSNIQTGAIPYGQGTSRFATTTQGTGGFVLGWANGIPTWVATSSIQNITLTTTGTSGASTLTGNTLNIPQYAGTTYTATYPVTLSGTAFGIAFGTTTANTWSDTQTFSKAINVTEGTTATSTFSGNARVIGNLQVDGKFFAPVTLVTTGDTTINGALTVTGATTLATSLTGFLKGTSGLVSAVSSLVPGDISLTKGNFLVGNDAGIAQATSTIFISSTGNVGIGSTSPEAKLSVAGTLSTTGVITSYATGGESFKALGTTGPMAFRLTNTGNDVYFGSEGSSAGGFFTGSLAYSSVIYSNTAIQQIIGGVSRMIINTSGNVGIGNTSPLAKLHIVGANTAVDSFGQLAVMTSDTFAANTGAEIALGGGYSASATTTFAGIAGRKENSTSGDFAGYLQLFTSINGSGNAERMRITSAGNVGIGTIAPGSKLQVSSANSEYLPSTSAFSIRKNEEGYGLFSGVSGSGNSWLQAGTSNDATNYNLVLQSRGGNVGIGTTAPGSKLTVAGTAATPSRLLDIGGTTTGFNYASISNTSGSLWWGVEGSATGQVFASSLAYASVLGSSNSTALQLATNGTVRMTLDTSGNVGIGNTSPGAKLHVVGGGVVVNTTGGAGTSIGRHINLGSVTTPTDWRSYTGNTTAAIQMENSATEGFVLAATQGAVVPRTQFITTGGYEIQVGATIGGAGTNALQILSNGNVGIGTTTPAALFSVAGTGYFTTGIGIGVASPTNSLKIVKSGQGYNSEGTPAIRILDTVTGNTALQMGVDDTKNIGFIQAMQPLTSFSTRALVLQGNGGNVGIGTTSTTAKLDISSDGSVLNRFIGLNDTAASGRSYGIYNRLLGTAGLFGIYDNTAGAARLVIDSTGNVGIGVTSPLAKLDISSDAATQFTPTLSVRGTANSTSNGLEWGHVNAAGYGSTIGHLSSAGNPYIAFNGEAGTSINTFKTRGIKSSIIMSDLAGGMQFGNVGTAATTDNQTFVPLVSVLSSGNVGIGTTASNDKLEIGYSNAGTAISNGGGLIVSNTNATTNNYAGLSFSDGNVGGSGSGGIFGQLTDRVSHYGDIAFATRSAGGYTEKVRITSTGNVGIGTTTPGTILSIGDTTNFINFNNTATSTFAFGLKAPTAYFSGLVEFAGNVLARAGTVLNFSNATVKQHTYSSFSYATSTAWTATTTIPLGPAYTAELWSGVKCFTDTGTLNVSFYDGTNRMNMLNASTTVGTVTLSTNNTFTASEARYVDIGTPATSPTKISCTVDKIVNN